MSKWAIRTYITDTGNKPVDEWIRGLNPTVRAEVIANVRLLAEFGTDLRMPHARYVRDGIWELRPRSANTIERVLYFHWFGRTFGLLHGFTKRTQGTRRTEIEIALERRAIWLSRPGPETKKGGDGDG